MNKYRLLLMVLVPAYLSTPASGGIFFNKQGKVNPATRVPNLIMTLRADQDDHKREKAAQELRNFDSGQFPEIVPNLIETAHNDPKSGVRMEAVTTIGKLRPVSQQAGLALEQVIDKDSSMRVRLHARSVLVQYYLAGYRSSKTDEAPTLNNKTGEPPLADPPGIAPARPPVSSGRLAPVAQPVSRAKPKTGSPPVSSGPVSTNEPPLLLTPPSSSKNEGPEFP
jgi:hypothetical protein